MRVSYLIFRFANSKDSIDILDLIDDYLKTHRQGDKSGQYNLVEDKTVFKGGLTTFYGLLNYRKKLQALDDGSDPLYVEARMLQATTALNTNLSEHLVHWSLRRLNEEEEKQNMEMLTVLVFFLRMKQILRF